MNTAKNLKELRVKLGLSQRNFASLLSVNKSTIAAYETGDRFPSFPTAQKIVDVATSRGITITLEYVRPRIYTI